MPNNNNIKNDEPKSFVVPVEWAVYSTVVVKGANSIEEACRLVEEHIDDIPLASHPNYIDGSYMISTNDPVQLQAMQDCTDNGVEMDVTNKTFIGYELL